MKFNRKGSEIFEKWCNIWDAAVALECAYKGDKNAEYGTSVISNYLPIYNSLDSIIGELLITYQEEAIYTVFSWMARENAGMDSEYSNELTYRGVIYNLLTCFDISNEELAEIRKKENEFSVHHSKVKVRTHSTKRV